MGYELHIVRNEDWFEEETGGGISFAEWQSLVDADDTMRMDGYAEVKLPDGSTLRTENKGLAVWTEYKGNVVGGNQAWFDFGDGTISVKNPDQEILTKMLEISEKLDAKVIGDDGEEYKSPTDLSAPETPSAQLLKADRSKPWWRFW